MGKLPGVDGDDDAAHSLVETGTEVIANGNVGRQLGEKAMVVEDHDRSTAHRPVPVAAAAGVCMMVVIV
jgi:hypothetical protein